MSTENKKVKYFEDDRKFNIPKRPCKCSIYCINTDEIPNHACSSSIFSAEKGMIYHVTSHNNGDLFTCEDLTSCFHV